MAWSAAQWRPDRFHAVAALSVPWMPRGPVRQTQALEQAVGDQWFYFLSRTRKQTKASAMSKAACRNQETSDL